MKILVLGGTRFLGRHIVEAAMARNHELTLFNRGRHNAELFPELETVRGDRDTDLSALRGRRFDAIIDPSGYTPAHMAAIASALGESCPHYIFISSIAAYKGYRPGQSYSETTPLAQGEDGYGALKARAEEAIEAALPGQVAHIRPGLIVGPYDPTGRFTYWPRRIAAAGHVLAPGRRQRPVQIIDARDVADWCVVLAENRIAGVFNAVGPASPLTMEELLDECCRVTGTKPTISWMPDDDLLAQAVTPWTELPLWLPENDPRLGGMLLAENHKAIAAGLRFRALADTIDATLEWDRQYGSNQRGDAMVSTLTRAREAQLLAC